MNQVCLEPPTPMAFSRCSSLTSLNSFDVKSVHSSVNSEYSMIVSKTKNELASPGAANGNDEDDLDDLDKLMPESPAAANNSFKTAQRIMHKQQQLQYRQSAILAMSGGDLKALVDQPGGGDGDAQESVEPAKNNTHFTLHTPPVKLMPQPGKFAAAPASSTFVSSGIGSFGMAPGGSFAQPMQFNFQNPIHVNKSMPVLSAAAAFNAGAAKPFAFLKNPQSQFNGMPPLPPKFLANRQLNMAADGFSKPPVSLCQDKMTLAPPPSWQLPLMPSTSVSSSSLDSEDVPVVYGQCRTPRRFKQNSTAESVSSSHQNSPPESVCSHMSTSSVPSVIREDLNSKNQRFNTYLNMLNAQSSSSSKEALFPRANRDKSQHYFILNTPSSSASSHFNDTLVGGESGAAKTGLKLLDQHDENHLERHFMRDTRLSKTPVLEEPGAPVGEDELLSSERPSFLDDDEQPRTFVTEETPNQSILNEAKSKASTLNQTGTVQAEFSSYFARMSLSQPIVMGPPLRTATVFGMDSQYRFNQKQVPFNFVERSAHMEQQIAQQATFSDRSESWSFQNYANFVYKNDKQLNTPAEFASLSGNSNLEESDQAEVSKQPSSEPEEQPFDQSKEEEQETSIMREHDEGRPFDDGSDDELILQNFIDEMLPHVIGNSGAARQAETTTSALVSSPAYGKMNNSLNELDSLMPNNTPNLKISTINLAVKPPLIVKRASLNIKQGHELPPWAAPGVGGGIKFPKRNSNGSTHELAQSTNSFLATTGNELKASALTDRTNRMFAHTHQSANALNLSNLSTNSVGSHGNKGSGASSIENSCKLARASEAGNKPQFKKRLSAEAFDLKLSSQQNLSPSVGRKLTSKLSSSKLNKPTIASSSSSHGLNAASSRPVTSNLKHALTASSSRPAAEKMNTTISTHPVITMTKTAQLRANANQAKKPATVLANPTVPKILATNLRAKPRSALNETHSYESKMAAEAASSARRKSLVLEKPGLLPSAAAKPKPAAPAPARQTTGAKPVVVRPAFKAK